MFNLVHGDTKIPVTYDEINATDNIVTIRFVHSHNLALTVFKLEMSYDQFKEFAGDMSCLLEDTKDV